MIDDSGEVAISFERWHITQSLTKELQLQNIIGPTANLPIKLLNKFCSIKNNQTLKINSKSWLRLTSHTKSRWSFLYLMLWWTCIISKMYKYQVHLTTSLLDKQILAFLCKELYTEHLSMTSSSVHSVLPTDAGLHSYLVEGHIDPSGWSELRGGDYLQHLKQRFYVLVPQ